MRRFAILLMFLFLMPLCLAHDDGMFDSIIDYAGSGSSSMVVILVLSFVLGMLHTATPGHGKSVIVSYLLGKHATVKNVILIALSTAITHISDVFIVGLLLLFVIPSSFKPVVSAYLGKASAILILVLGLYLLYRSFSHKHDHHHKRSGLIIAGVVVGLAPCPTAWALYLVLVGMGLYFKAFLSVLVFGLGTLLTITLLGILLIKAKRLLKYFPGEGSFVKYFPVASAVLITVIGAVMVLKNFF